MAPECIPRPQLQPAAWTVATMAAGDSSRDLLQQISRAGCKRRCSCDRPTCRLPAQQAGFAYPDGRCDPSASE